MVVKRSASSPSVESMEPPPAPGAVSITGEPTASASGRGPQSHSRHDQVEPVNLRAVSDPPLDGLAAAG